MTTIAVSDELVVLLDADGKPCGEELKRLVHDGATRLHLALSVYIVNRRDEVLITQRSHRKRTWPGVWTNACCGHPLPGESLRQAVDRRLRVELGLEAQQVALAFPDFHYRAVMADGTVENELCPVVVALVDGEASLNPDEVEDARWCCWADFLELAEREPPELSPWAVAQARRFASLGASPADWLRGRAPDVASGVRLRWSGLDAPALARSTPERTIPADSAMDVGAVAATEEILRRFLGDVRAELEVLDPSTIALADAIERLVGSGGKRLRPSFVYWGHRASGREPVHGVLVAAAAVELLHTFALIHDDVMDRSPTRRGQPSAHVAFADRHRSLNWSGDDGWFGNSAAIVAGDLAFVWAQQLFDTAVIADSAGLRARAVFRKLQIEVMAGQYLDLCMARPFDVGAIGEGAREAETPTARARRVALLKSGRYTVTRPLQLGAVIGGADEGILDVLAAYGDAIGLAFQMRDDVLGLMGDERSTGKSTSDDLREGKRTVLILQALDRATAAERAVLNDALGDANIDVETCAGVREIVVRTGALDAVEHEIARLVHVAVEAAERVDASARDALIGLAHRATARNA